MADVPAAISELGDKIANLKLTEAVALKNYLKEKYGLEPAAGGAVMMAAPGAGGGGAAAAEKPPEKTEFTVVLESVDAAKKIAVIKLVREITGLGLVEGKKLVDEAPKTIKENVSKDDAEAIKKKLEDAGGKVSLK